MTEVEPRQLIPREEIYCEECGKNSFLTDEIRVEIACRYCGIVRGEKIIDFSER